MDYVEFVKSKKFIYQISENFVDVTDRMHFVFTPTIFLSIFTLLSVKIFYLKVIYCTVPFEFPKPWEDFVQNYCWVQPTYHLMPNGRFPKHSEKKFIQTNNIHWTPMVFFMQALLCFVPYFLWIKLKQFCDIDSMIKLKTFKPEVDLIKHQEIFKGIANSIVCLLENRLTNYHKINSQNNLLDKNKFKIQNFGFLKYFYKRTGNSLFSYYLIVKVMFISIGFLHVYLMKSFLGDMKYTFGYDILSNIIYPKQRENSSYFPRIVGCDILISQAGQERKHSFLCVVPINMIYEKLYMILWFWILSCILLTFGSIIFWCIKICPLNSRKHFIMKLLMMQGVSKLNKSIIKEFTVDFLRLDGYFILKMLSFNSSLYVSSFVCKEIWKIYKIKRNKWNEFNNKHYL